jgi:hypothetical protein
MSKPKQPHAKAAASTSYLCPTPKGVDPSEARRARIRRRRTATQPASGSRSETGTRVRRLEREEQEERPAIRRSPGASWNRGGVDPERQHTSGAKRAHAVISGGRRIERAKCTRARSLF